MSAASIPQSQLAVAGFSISRKLPRQISKESRRDERSPRYSFCQPYLPPPDAIRCITRTGSESPIPMKETHSISVDSLLHYWPIIAVGFFLQQNSILI